MLGEGCPDDRAAVKDPRAAAELTGLGAIDWRQRSLGHLYCAGNTHCEGLRCDLIDPSGAVDALDAVSVEMRNVLLTPDLLFPDVCEGLRYGGSISKGDQAEYARLVVRQLRCRKVDLALSVEA